MLEERVGVETVLHHLERPNTVPAANQPKKKKERKKKKDSLQTASPRMH